MAPPTPSRRSRRRPAARLGGRARATVALAAGLVALLTQPAVAAPNPIVPLGSTHAELAVGVGDDGRGLAASFGFHLLEAKDAYLKVLPTEGNPAYRNGVAGQAGWWTDVTLASGGVREPTKQTDGRGNVELGSLEPGVNYTLELRLHAPVEALRVPALYEIAYSLAGRAVEGNGSGAVRDPSIGLTMRLQVGEPGVVALGDEGWGWTEKAAVIGGAAALGLLVVALVALRRIRRSRRTTAWGEA